jgi:hypothetical protein
MNDVIHQTKGYKYRTTQDFAVQTPYRPKEYVRRYLGDTLLIELSPSGLRTIKAGYSHDGASGFTWDDNWNTGPCLGHDADYELLRQFGEDVCGFTREESDRWCYVELARVARLLWQPKWQTPWRSMRGALYTRGRIYYRALRVGGGPSATDKRKIWKSPY